MKATVISKFKGLPDEHPLRHRRARAHFQTESQAINYAIALWNSEDEEPRVINFESANPKKAWTYCEGQKALFNLRQGFSDLPAVYQTWGEF